MVLGILLATACSPSGPLVEGRVTDIWGNPIEGATVMVEGGSERPLTDSSGRYAIERLDGKRLIKAGRKGYIQDHHTVAFEADTPTEGPTFTLYPQPERFGLFLVQHDHYSELTPKRVNSVGNALRSYRGTRSTGEVIADRSQPTVLWHIDVPQEQAMGLQLELRRLDFLRRGKVPSPSGETDVNVNLYVDAGAVPTEIEPLRSRFDYLVRVSEPLTPGLYAFQTQGLLTADMSVWSQTAPELRTVHPFEVR
ncbi:MAG: carboxypeptidase-like regulatory domain-containing protein [Myxococcales bacterium]|nr:carboxypeptidase-like regulatory domain-containing protein [Myxococcales bacterium]